VSGTIELWLWVEMDGGRPFADVHRERFEDGDTERWWRSHLDGVGLEDTLWPNGDEVVHGWWYIRGHMESDGVPWSMWEGEDYDEWFEVEEERRLWFFPTTRVRLLDWYDHRCKRLHEDRVAKEGGCVLWCQQCRGVLNDGSSSCEQVEDPRASPGCTYEYVCGWCGKVSRFQFDMPVPFLMEPLEKVKTLGVDAD
jgi:hypothetical protein